VVKAQVKFEPRDLWVGLYWDRSTFHWHIYLCLLPLLPLHIWWPHTPKPPFPGAAD
jgi:hypothetical protein